MNWSEKLPFKYYISTHATKHAACSDYWELVVQRFIKYRTKVIWRVFSYWLRILV